MAGIFNFTIKDIQEAEDPKFLRHEERSNALQEPSISRIYGSTVQLKTKSSRYAKNQKIYTQLVLFKDFVLLAKDKKIPIGEAIEYALNEGDVHIMCDCPANLYWGYQYTQTQLGINYGTNKVNIFPKVRNPDLKGVQCKHLARALKHVQDRSDYILASFAKLYKDVIIPGVEGEPDLEKEREEEAKAKEKNKQENGSPPIIDKEGSEASEESVESSLIFSKDILFESGDSYSYDWGVMTEEGAGLKRAVGSLSIFNSVESISSSIIDPVRETLSPELWNESKTLKPFVREQVFDLIEDSGLPIEDVDGLYFVGSMTGYQYNDMSDIDIHIRLDGKSQNEIDEYWDSFKQGELLKGTEHPINFYLYSGSEFEGKSGKGAVYDLLNQEWIEEPVREEVSIPYDYIIEIAKIFMAGIDNRIMECNSDIDEYKLLKDYISTATEGEREELEEVIKLKNLEVMADFDSLKIVKDMLYSLRTGSYEGEEFDLFINMGKGNKSVQNAVYKILERFGYIDRLKEYMKKRQQWTKTESIQSSLVLSANEKYPIEKMFDRFNSEIFGEELVKNFPQYNVNRSESIEVKSEAKKEAYVFVIPKLKTIMLISNFTDEMGQYFSDVLKRNGRDYLDWFVLKSTDPTIAPLPVARTLKAMINRQYSIEPEKIDTLVSSDYSEVVYCPEGVEV